MSNAITKGGTAEVVREGFGETSIEKRGETGTSALAAQATAEVNARYVMALQRPRDPDVVRAKLLKECSRPGFAERAFFSLPRGNQKGRLTGTPGRIEGLTVRFAEAAIRLSGNILQGTKTLYDDDYKRMLNVSATDLETNAVYSRDILIEKTVERSKPKDGTVVLAQRTNSAGNVVYIVQATDDELLQKEGALISKTFRTLSLRLVPPDVIEECEQRIIATLDDEHSKDPDAARKKLCDAFFALGISPDALKEYVGHGLDNFSAQEKRDLTGLHAALKDGDVSWAEAFAEKTAGRAGAGAGAATTAPTADADKKTPGATVAERIKARTADKPATPPPADTKASGPVGQQAMMTALTAEMEKK